MFMARSPAKPTKPVHTPNPGLSEAPVAFDHGRAPMFAPVNGPRLTPEEAVSYTHLTLPTIYSV